MEKKLTPRDLKSNEKEVILISAFKTKTNKSCVQFAFDKKVMGEYEKGFPIVMSQWFDTLDIFNKLKSDSFGRKVKVSYEYKERNNGQAYFSIVDICS